MREIKFRAWDNSQAIMHKEVEFIRSGTEQNDWIIFKSDRNLLENNEVLTNPYCQQQINIMQYTGLKDKNCKEIYEGDVVIQYEIPNKPFDVKREVFFSDGMFCVGKIGETETPLYLETNTSYRGKNVNLIEVIGNKFENPELLESTP